MDASRFDGITKRLSQAGSRRGFLNLLAELSVGGTLAALLGEGTEGAQARPKKRDDRGSSHRRQRRKARHKHGQDKDQLQHNQRANYKGKHENKGREPANGTNEPSGGNRPPNPVCQPESPADTCHGTCGMVANRCDVQVDCGACGCDPPCDRCMTCDLESLSCVPGPPVCCGDDGGVCSGGVCAPCGDGRRCVRDGVCSCDDISCPNGCCDLSAACRIDDDLACGTGGGVCDVCNGTGETCGGGGQAGVCGCEDDGTACDGRTCGAAVNNCGETVPCTGCSGCCTGTTCQARGAQNVTFCGRNGEPCHSCGMCEACQDGECVPAALGAPCLSGGQVCDGQGHCGCPAAAQHLCGDGVCHACCRDDQCFAPSHCNSSGTCAACHPTITFCTRDEECCDYFVRDNNNQPFGSCGKEAFGQRVCCLHNQILCTTDSQCCTGYCEQDSSNSNSGFCACIPSGPPGVGVPACTRNGDCCSNQCQDGQCRCLPSGAPCPADAFVSLGCCSERCGTVNGALVCA